MDKTFDNNYKEILTEMLDKNEMASPESILTEMQSTTNHLIIQLEDIKNDYQRLLNTPTKYIEMLSYAIILLKLKKDIETKFILPLRNHL